MKPTVGRKIRYYPYTLFTDEQLPLLKVTALFFDQLYILGSVGVGLDNVVGQVARKALRPLGG